LPAPPLCRVDWRPCHRIVPSRFPPVGLFDRVADPADLEAVFAVEALTNPRLRNEAGELALVPPAERVSGPGTTPVMAAFTHLNPEGSRFSDGSYGVYYAARSIETAIEESRFHRERFLRRTREPPIEVDMRAYLAHLSGELHDLRGSPGHAALDPVAYAAGQALGGELRAAGSGGIAYPSVRHPGGECAAIFRPRLLSKCVQGPHFGYRWDGERIVAVLRLALEKSYD
jgi:hypothetical protein